MLGLGTIPDEESTLPALAASRAQARTAAATVVTS
jgi:hypothetical protein